jgi:hypothetical protein
LRRRPGANKSETELKNMINFECDGCGETIAVPRKTRGRLMDCPACKAVVKVPQPPPLNYKPAAVFLCFLVLCLLSGPAARLVGLTELYDGANTIQTLDHVSQPPPTHQPEDETTNRLNAETSSSLKLATK